MKAQFIVTLQCSFQHLMLLLMNKMIEISSIGNLEISKIIK